MVGTQRGVDPVGHSRDLQKTGQQAATAGRLYPRGLADGFGYGATGDFAGAVCVGRPAAGMRRGGAGGARHRGIRAIVTPRWRSALRHWGTPLIIARAGGRERACKPADLKGTDMFKEFKAFAMRGNVIDLAVGVII